MTPDAILTQTARLSDEDRARHAWIDQQLEKFVRLHEPPPRVGTLSEETAAKLKACCCSFCRKPQENAKLMITGDQARICDQCVADCVVLVKTKLGDNS